jgi:hypothetical protein
MPPAAATVGLRAIPEMSLALGASGACDDISTYNSAGGEFRGRGLGVQRPAGVAFGAVRVAAGAWLAT